MSGNHLCLREACQRNHNVDGYQGFNGFDQHERLKAVYCDHYLATLIIDSGKCWGIYLV